MPDGRVEAAGGEEGDGAAGRDGQVGHDEARVVRGQARVDLRREDAVARVEEEEGEEDEGREGAELEGGADLEEGL